MSATGSQALLAGLPALPTATPVAPTLLRFKRRVKRHVDPLTGTGIYPAQWAEWRTTEEALDAFGRALQFPDHYRRNVNALVDCLRDVVVRRSSLRGVGSDLGEPCLGPCQASLA